MAEHFTLYYLFGQTFTLGKEKEKKKTHFVFGFHFTFIDSALLQVRDSDVVDAIRRCTERNLL